MSYKGNSIQVLDHREAVRMRPGMYIGGVDNLALHHLIWEIVDNSVDEYLAGHATEIEVRVHQDGRTITIKDNGRGIPIDIEPKTQRPAVEVVFTKLHAGGKFEDNNAYKSSGGLHGVGAAVTNFLSESLTVEVHRDNEIHRMSFCKGILSEDLEKIGDYKGKTSGTTVMFEPDSEIFTDIQFKQSLIAQRLEIKSYVNPGLKIHFHYEPTQEESFYYHPDGIREFMPRIIAHKKTVPLHDAVYFKEIELDTDNISVEVCFTWTESTQEHFISFANAIPTQEGGTHEQGFKEGLIKAVRSVMDTYRDMPKRLSINTDDIREGVVAIINVFTEGECVFHSQNKTKLTNPEIQNVVAGVIRKELEGYLFENPSVADLIIQRVISAAKARNASRAITKASKKSKKNASKLTMPGKLADCSSNKPSECELFLVEGDSAGGNAKVARNRINQAILPLRGKVLNVETSKMTQVLKNQELDGIINALGCGVGPSLDLSMLRYHKVILLMDADSDGHHITTLLLTFFLRLMPDLIRQGHLYVALPPLYTIKRGSDRYWAQNDAEKDHLVKTLSGTLEISRFKGLGEMMADTLKETALDPSSRNLVRITLPEDQEGEIDTVISDLMGRNVKARKRYIQESLEASNS